MAAGAGVRAARRRDLEAIAGVYRHYVERSYFTFESNAPDAAEWARRFDVAAERGHPWLVAVPAGEVVGYAIASTFLPRAAYHRTVQTAIYLRPDERGRGLGRALYAALVDEAAARGFHLAVAGIALPNPASLALHEAIGFVPVGVFAEVGRKFGVWRDVSWWQRRLAHT
jgi:L-amino acid N-acyltransferase YncA